MSIAYIALGSNLGDRRLHLRAAIHAMGNDPRLAPYRQARAASLYETAPVGGPAGQSPYLNSVVGLETSAESRDLLDALLSIEANLGRTREQRWEARVIDLDLLFYDKFVVDHRGLTLPHPRLHQRLFVLEPLAELAGDLIHPVLNVSILTLRDRLRNEEMPASVARVAGPEWAQVDRPPDSGLKNKLDFPATIG